MKGYDTSPRVTPSGRSEAFGIIMNTMTQTSDLDLVTLGEAMALFIATQTGPLAGVGQFARATAGAELNVATGVARLGLRVGYLSALGQDHLGQGLLDFLDHEGIDRRAVQVDTSHPTGLMFKSRQDDGRDPAIEYFRRGSAASHLCVTPEALAYARGARRLHLTGIAPALSDSVRTLVFALARQARASGQALSFDPNLRPRLWASPDDMIATLNALAALSDLVMPGLEEGQRLTGRTHPQDIADFYLARGSAQVIIKLGARGAFVADREGAVQVPGVAVARVVDTVGAGDGFAAGVISGLLEGLSLAQAAARGNLIGARVVTFPGDSDGLPTRAQLQADQERTARGLALGV